MGIRRRQKKEATFKRLIVSGRAMSLDECGKSNLVQHIKGKCYSLKKMNQKSYRNQEANIVEANL